MNRLSIVLLLLLGVGCVGSPPAPVTSLPTPAAPQPTSQPAPAVEPEEALAPATSIDLVAEVNGRAKQCAAGGAAACLSLCQDQAECDSKDECNELASSIPPCGDTKPGSLCQLAADQIAPTQAAVGMFAADCRALKITNKNTDSGKKLKRYLLERPVPAVVGPDGRFFITDRHHLSTGVLKADIQPERKRLYMCAMADKTTASTADFWSYMEANSFTWLYDQRGHEITPAQLPARLEDLADDPYRTLSRWVRNSCGFIKCGTVCGGDGGGGDDNGGSKTSDLERCKTCPVSPYFLEFKWANYLRGTVPIAEIYRMTGKPQANLLRQHLNEAMQAVARQAAIDQGLPGWNAGLIDTQLVHFDANECDQ